MKSPFLRPHISFHLENDVLQVRIETERLYILSYEDSDFENYLSLYSNETITKYFDHGKTRSRNEVEELIKKKGKKYFINKKPFGFFSIFNKKDMAFMGEIDLLPYRKGTVEIGFILDTQFHNQGFCSEAVKAFIRYYVEELNHNDKFEISTINHVMATVHPENQPSRKILEKTGMSLDRIHDRFGHPRLWYSMPTSMVIRKQKIGI